ncbi:MAG TPA: divalent-cation tolerance protein CutA [Firmicutes bacterium]|nr:divalent-cation tolerance protein CutA [Bacillota bacterium]
MDEPAREATATPAGYLVYTTTSSEEEALRIGRAVVEQHLAACANVLPGITSIYPWHGRINEDSEAWLLLKTTATRLAALIARIRELHSYELPAINAIRIDQGLPEFWDWVKGWVDPA